MVITLARAIAWGVSGLLGLRDNELVAQHDLEHAHWDPVTRTWFVHEETVFPGERRSGAEVSRARLIRPDQPTSRRASTAPNVRLK